MTYGKKEMYMRVKVYCLAVFMMICACSKTNDESSSSDSSSKSDLDSRYKSQWAAYTSARSADNENYLTNEEKEVFYYLNLMRINPPLFARTYATGYDGDEGWIKGYAWDERKESLIAELSTMEALPLLYPDVQLYELAHCFADEGGKLGITGHDRSKTSCDTGYKAECCHYGGARNGLSVVMSLLIDAGENNGALGHRRICFSGNYVKLGVSIQPHTKYEFNAVLDFGY